MFDDPIHNDPTGDIALRTTITDIVAKRDAALAKFSAAAEALDAAYAMTAEAEQIAKDAHHGKKYYGGHGQSEAFDNLHRGRFDGEASLNAARKELDARTWSFLIDHTGLDELMDHEAKEAFQRDLASDPPEVTEDNVRATLRQMIGDADLIWKRGMANVFSSLDRRFRSHDAFKIGSRIILDRAFDEHGSMNWHSGFRDKIIDIERIFRRLNDGAMFGGSILYNIEAERRGTWGARQSEHVGAFFKIRIFKRGTAHLWFSDDRLVREVNKILAEYYGDVIPDGMDDRAADDIFRDVKLTPAKRFGFFPSPPAVVDAIFSNVHGLDGARVLEPSAGTGNIARKAVAQGAIVDCVEIQKEHADTLRAEGIYNRVSCQDFLTFSAKTPYDVILLNPPFDRGRDIDHIMHAWSMLAPGGKLVSVMHAGVEFSETKKAKAFRAFAKKFGRGWRGPFQDLPPASFAEVGTYVNTVIVTLVKAPE